ncbi:MAG: hypothetical protein AAB337_00270 [Patescibacteria group bacterium]
MSSTTLLPAEIAFSRLMTRILILLGFDPRTATTFGSYSAAVVGVFPWNPSVVSEICLRHVWYILIDGKRFFKGRSWHSKPEIGISLSALTAVPHGFMFGVAFFLHQFLGLDTDAPDWAKRISDAVYVESVGHSPLTVIAPFVGALIGIVLCLEYRGWCDWIGLLGTRPPRGPDPRGREPRPGSIEIHEEIPVAYQTRKAA